MILTLPDDPALADLSEETIRLDLACALFAAGRISRGVACRLAAVSRSELDKEIFRRGIPIYSEEMLEADLANLQKLFPV